MPTVPLIPASGFYRDANLHWSSQDVLNLLPTQAENSGAKTQLMLRGCPGLKPYRRIRVDGNPVGRGRGLHNVEGKLFAVVGTKLYQITDAGGFIERGTIPGVRRVSMAHNQYKRGNQLSIVNGYAGYIYDTTTQTTVKITDDGFPGGLITFFVDQYLGYVDPTGEYWGHSDLGEGKDYNTLDTYEAEGFPDKIVSAIVSHREVLVFGKSSTEPYVNSPSGDGTAPFVRANNTAIESGCAATFSPAKAAGNVVYLDHNLSVQVLNGYDPVPVSTSAIEQAFAECTPDEISQAYAFAWEPEGYRVYYITVPNKFTFGYDFVNKQWHRRASNGLSYWAVSDVVKWNGKWIAQDSRNGDLYELDFKYPREGCDELIREWSTPPLHELGRRIEVHETALLVNTGGEDIHCAEWLAQPDGPSISGSAPDGIQGEAYAFTYTITSGDASIVRTTIDESALLAGLSWNQANATISGTPIVGGTMTITPRVVDANELWDELTDEIYIEAVVTWDDTFKYKVETGGISNTNDYSALDYDDSAWTEGQGAFGSSPLGGLSGQEINTYVEGALEKIIWLRKRITLPVADYRINAYHDDGVWVWWNGAPLTMTTVETYHSTVVVPADDVAETNVIVIKVIDGYPSGSANIYAAMDLAEESP